VFWQENKINSKAQLTTIIQKYDEENQEFVFDFKVKTPSEKNIPNACAIIWLFRKTERLFNIWFNKVRALKITNKNDFTKCEIFSCNCGELTDDKGKTLASQYSKEKQK
jgi:hypothetical protein